MHAVLALTTKHDRYLTPTDPNDSELQALELHHYGRAAALFNQKLSTHSDASAHFENDALWSCAVFMGNLASSSVDGDAPEDVWPMKDGTSGEALSWLKIHEGLRILWYFSEPYAPGRIFHKMVNHPEHKYMKTKLDPQIQPGIEGIPADFVALCRLDENSDMINSPYQKAVRNLVALLDLEFNPVNMLKFMSYTALMDARYKILLREKDPAALVLLSWWYAFMSQAHWFIAKRALLECKSICMYLEQASSDDALVQKMLRFPKKRTGLSKKFEWESQENEYRPVVITRTKGGFQHVGSWI